MNLGELLRWQYAGYEKFHQSLANLKIHIVVVPLFWLGNVSLVLSLARQAWLAAALSIAAMVASMAFQGRRHRGEKNPTEPFTSPMNFFARIFLEQWITFPRFVLSGGWLRALRLSARRSSIGGANS
jgi:hypothetical protein